MSDIFVSYDDRDRPRVRRIVQTFEAHGWSVWWDHRISTGEPFSQVIERELQAASCVVVVWTDNSVQSEWVRAEADEARKHRKLVPVRLDDVTPPMPFGQIQTADLVDWKDEGHEGLAKLVADLRERIGKAPVSAEPKQTTGPRRFESWTRAAGIAALLLAAGTGAWYLLSAPPEPRAPNGRQEVDTSVVQGPRSVDTPAAVPPPDRAEAARNSSAARSVPSVNAASVAGDWQARVTYTDGASFEERFTFAVDGRELSGTASMRGYGNRRGVLSGTIDGNRLSFRTKGSVQFSLSTIRDVTFVYKGTLEGDAIRFTVEDEGIGDPAVAFTARRISAEQASRIATGGRRPRLTSMDLGQLYPLDHIRERVASRQGTIDACYQAAEFDEVNHEFVDVRLTLSAAGMPEQFEMRPKVTSLESCLRDMLFAIEWGPTATGKGGTVRIGFTARLPWNP